MSNSKLHEIERKKSYKENHDEERGEITAALHPPHRNESIVFSGDDVAQVSFVVFLLCQNFDTRHQKIIKAEKFFENETTERVTEALVGLRIQRDDFYWYVETLSGCC